MRCRGHFKNLSLRAGGAAGVARARAQGGSCFHCHPAGAAHVATTTVLVLFVVSKMLTTKWEHSAFSVNALLESCPNSIMNGIFLCRAKTTSGGEIYQNSAESCTLWQVFEILVSWDYSCEETTVISVDQLRWPRPSTSSRWQCHDQCF